MRIAFRSSWRDGPIDACPPFDLYDRPCGGLQPRPCDRSGGPSRKPTALKRPIVDRASPQTKVVRPELLDLSTVHFDGPAHSIAVAGALHASSVIGVDGRSDRIATQRSRPGQNSILVRAGEPGVADDVRTGNPRFSGSRSWHAFSRCRIAQAS